MLRSSATQYAWTMEILLVDDDPEVRSALADLLRAEGHRVEVACTGDEALDRLQDRRFELLVSDLEMPGADGDVVIRRARRSQPELPAVLVSSHPEAPARGRALGVPVVAKPVAPEALRSAIERALRSEPLPEGPKTTAKTTAKTKDPLPGTVVVVEPRRAPARPWFPALAAATLMVAAGLLFFRDVSAPELPEPPGAGVVRGSGLELVAPTGPLAAPPTAFEWRSLSPSSQARVVLEGVDGRVLYQQVVPLASVADDGSQRCHFELPTDLVASFRPMVAYTWWVESLDDEGAPTARSSRGRFRVLVDALPSTTGDSP